MINHTIMVLDDEGKEVNLLIEVGNSVTYWTKFAKRLLRRARKNKNGTASACAGLVKAKILGFEENPKQIKMFEKE